MSFSTRSRRLVVPLVATVVLAVALAFGLATALASSSAPSPASGKVVLRIGWTTEPDNLNPFIGWFNSTYEIWAINYDFLFSTSGSMKPALDLVTEFPTQQNGGISADGKVWTFHLRPNVKWSDGQPLTADDVAFTYNYVVQNHMANMAVTTVGIEKAVVVDPLTVKIICSRPKADMEHIFLPILPKHIWEKVDPKVAQTNYNSKPPIVGSGPFITTVFKKGSYIQMDRNPYYWGPKPAVDQILFLTYTNADSMTADLKSGGIDAAWGIPQAQFDSLSSVKSIKPVAYNFMNWDYMSINCFTGKSLGNPVLKDWRFRNALNYAIDRNTLCRIAYSGKATPGTTILPPSTWTDPDFHWQPPTGTLYTFDLAKANQLLDQAGYAKGADGIREYQGKPITLRLWASTESAPEQSDVKLIAGWLQQLGLKITLGVLDSGALESRIWNFQGDAYVPDFDLYVWDWAGYGDPGQTLSAETGAQIGNTNEPCWANTQYDDLNTRQASTIDPNARKDVIYQMQQIMYEQTPWVVLAYPQYLEAYNTSRWTGWYQIEDGRGPAFNTTGNVQSYLDLKPAAKAGSSVGMGVWIAVAAAVVLVVALIVWLVRRRAPVPEEA